MSCATESTTTYGTCFARVLQDRIANRSQETTMPFDTVPVPALAPFQALLDVFGGRAVVLDGTDPHALDRLSVELATVEAMTERRPFCNLD